MPTAAWTVALACLTLLPLRGQTNLWQATSNSTGNYLYTNNGVNVGIGSVGTASTPLTIYQNSAYGKSLLLDTLATGQQSYVWFGDVGSPKYAVGKHVDNSFSIWDQAHTRNIMHVLPSGDLALLPAAGNVGIGTESPQYQLAVNGTIGAKEIVVTNTGWSDYVFDSTYERKSLEQVQAYIKEHHHLPDIPSAAEVGKVGVSVGEMQSKLLAKIEELTLHVIELNEKNKQLQQRIAEIEAH